MKGKLIAKLMAVGGWVERKSGDSGQRGRSQICQYRLLGIRDSPQNVRREKNERSWREGEERKERLDVRGTGSRRGCLTATPGAVRVGREVRESRRRGGTGT